MRPWRRVPQTPAAPSSGERSYGIGALVGTSLLAGVVLLVTYVPSAFEYYGRSATTLCDRIACVLLLAEFSAALMSIGTIAAALLASWIGARAAILLAVSGPWSSLCGSICWWNRRWGTCPGSTWPSSGGRGRWSADL